MRSPLNVARTALLLAMALAPAAHAAGTAAGSSITNTATATFTDPGGTPVTVPSNTSSLQVDEILDVTVVSNDAGNVAVTTPDADAVLTFTVTNIGNGPEAFALSVNAAVLGDDFDPANTRIYLDANANGTFEAGSDTLYVPGTSPDPVLAADGTQVVFVVSDIPSGLVNTNLGLVSLTAEALTVRATPGADAPGTTFAGQGALGSDAVVGSTQADGSAQRGYVVAQVATTFTKSQAVVNDPVFGTNAVPGATITYTLELVATGSGSLTGAAITDPVPAGTTYVPGSLTLNSVSLTDLADADAGSVAAGTVTVNLGTVTAPATNTVTFQVTIN